jgi:putative transposase
MRVERLSRQDFHLQVITLACSFAICDERFARRALCASKFWALYVDGTNFKVQRRRSTEKEPSLVVLGVDENNFRSILAIEPGSKDNVDSWRAVFSELKKRGLDGKSVRLGIMDGLPGLEKLFREEFPGC